MNGLDFPINPIFCSPLHAMHSSVALMWGRALLLIDGAIYLDIIVVSMLFAGVIYLEILIA